MAPHPFVPAITCGLCVGHDGDHEGRAYWTTADRDGAPTAKLPPLGVTVRRRPPVPPPAVVEELTGPELLRALARELETNTAELPAVLAADEEPGPMGPMPANPHREDWRERGDDW
jgi:hypothetical protein